MEVYTNDFNFTDIEQRYRVYVYAPPKGRVVGFLPEAWGESTSTRWASPLSDLFSGLQQTRAVVDEALKLAKGAGGVVGGAAGSVQGWLNSKLKSIVTKEQTANIWIGADPLTINGLKIVFVARTSAYNDVVKPCRFIQGLTLPMEGSKTGSDYELSPPSSVSIKIGNMLLLNEAIIKGVTIDWRTRQLDVEGWPIRAEVSMTVQSKYAYTLPYDTNLIGETV